MSSVVYPEFPAVERPHEPVHVNETLAEARLPGGSILCTYLPADPVCIILTYQDRNRHAEHEMMFLPKDGIREAIAVLQATLSMLEEGE